MQLLTCVSNFQVEEPAVIVEPHFMDMLFEQVRALSDTTFFSGGLTDPNRKRNQNCQEIILILIFELGTPDYAKFNIKKLNISP
jgi:hypothetical protein